MGLFGAIGDLLGGILGGHSASKAAGKATKYQVDAYNKAIGEEARQYDTTRADFQPFRDAGYSGLSQLGDLVGTNGAPKQQSAIDALRASPFYQSLFRNGQETLLQNASATGGLRGGNTERGLADFGSDTLMATIQQQLASLGGLAGMGMGATNSVANFGQNEANTVAGLLSSIGGAQASGALAKGGIQSQMWNNLFSGGGDLLGSLLSKYLPGASSGLAAFGGF